MRLTNPQRNIFKSDKAISALFGGAGSGKTLLGCLWTLRCIETFPKGSMGVILASTRKQMKNAVLREFNNILHLAGYRRNKEYFFNKSELSYYFPEHDIIINTYSYQNIFDYEGVQSSFAWADEFEMADDTTWEVINRRNRENKTYIPKGFDKPVNLLLITGYTSEPGGWIYQIFVEDVKKDIMLVHSTSTRDNMANLPEEYLSRLEQIYDEKSALRYIDGEWVSLSFGVCYYNYNAERNDSHMEYTGTERLKLSFDFNVDPMTLGIFQRHGRELHQIDEIVIRNSNIQEVMEELYNRYGDKKILGIDIYGDRSGLSRQQNSNLTLYMEIERFLNNKFPGVDIDMNVPRQNPGVRNRVEATNSCFKNLLGESILFINKDKCPKSRVDYETTAWKEGTSLIDKSDPQRTHATDMLGYIVWQELYNEPPRVGQGRFRR